MKKYISIIMLMLFGTISCEDVLETNPLDELTTETALSNEEGLTAALNSVYNTLQSVSMYGRDLVVIPELLSDNMRIALQNTNRLTGVAVNADRNHVAIWNTAYSAINRLNNVLVYSETVDASEATINSIKGQAYFLRALFYHNLVKTYARDPLYLNDFNLGVPIRTEPFSSLGDDDYPSRATVSENYTLIKNDLNLAIGLLANEGIPFYASQLAAKALLARVYLYEGSWQQAAEMATEVIDEAPFELPDDYTSVFSEDAESIFSIKFVQGESLGPNDALAAFYVSSGDAVLREDMIQAFNDGSERLELLRTEVQGPETVTKTLKFNSYQGSRLDNVPVLRLSEMYLTRAEANFENGTSIGETPLEDINVIRNRVGLDDLSTVTLDLILHERRVELAFEGHRFWDLKRKGMDIPKGVSGLDCVAECVIPYENYRIVAPLSQIELDANDNLEQNPDYN